MSSGNAKSGKKKTAAAKNQKAKASRAPRGESSVSQSAGSVDFLVGRDRELSQLRACVRAGRNVLLEGPVGVGKTHLALSAVQGLGRPFFRVDGDSRYTEQKLSGWFDPPAVIRKGFTEAAFVPGPLLQAMREGGVLFINELNRLPEGVQNILLPAIDEGQVSVPKLGVIHARPGFSVVATQNPKEFVATSHLSEAILDRFELVLMDYQTEAEELAIVQGKLGAKLPDALNPALPLAAVILTRATRSHPRIRRGASVRAAISIAELCLALMEDSSALSWTEAFGSAVSLALPTRIELERDVESDVSPQEDLRGLLKELVQDALSGAEKKKN